MKKVKVDNYYNPNFIVHHWSNEKEELDAINKMKYETNSGKDEDVKAKVNKILEMAAFL